MHTGPNPRALDFGRRVSGREIRAFGNIAHVFSTLVTDGKGWKVMTVLWDAEREGNRIPEKYLSAAAGERR